MLSVGALTSFKNEGTWTVPGPPPLPLQFGGLGFSIYPVICVVPPELPRTVTLGPDFE